MQWALMVVDVQFFLTVAAVVEQVMEYAGARGSDREEQWGGDGEARSTRSP